MTILALSLPGPWPLITIALRLLASWRSRRQARRDRAEFAELDAAALRDLGLGASEYLSYTAEAEGRAARSRRRLSSLY